MYLYATTLYQVADCIRPIVTIPKSSLDLTAEYDETGVWNLNS